MKTALSQLAVERPRHLKDALQRMSGSLADERLTPLAGGTDLFVYLNAGTHRGTRFLDLSPLAELRGIKATRTGIRIGALETFDRIARHPKMGGWPLLVQAARCVGAAQIQNRGTIGGNIANASPAGDSLPVLLAYDAIVHVASTRGERTVRFADLQTGYRQLAMESDELIVAVEIPAVAPKAAQFFRKVGTRAAQSISKVVFAGVLVPGRGGVMEHVRLAWGSMAPITTRAPRAEAALLGHKPSVQAAAWAGVALGEDLVPIDDIRSDAEYRLDAARNVLAQFLRASHAGYRG
ncbi:MAG: FAD binding domain-containing protein [Candidatus Eisenbacteria bacterium]|nr:FAD binding domain-containing protein [Candidatus Eisenbacteria bacterium]